MLGLLLTTFRGKPLQFILMFILCLAWDAALAFLIYKFAF
jgi:hypothetical protein